MQIDWATHGLMSIGECLRKLHYFVAVLCYSRLIFVEFFLSQSMECFLAAHRHALEYFDGALGVPCTTILRRLSWSGSPVMLRSLIRVTWILPHTTASSRWPVMSGARSNRTTIVPFSPRATGVVIA